jgi:peptidoglycan/LPS O-acetylase OafA/YrhL
MGVLRLLLAFIVVIAHTSGGAGLEIIDGAQAVRVFFIVSGFYMALILSEKYTNSLGTNLRLFYSNRALRIVPLLWLVLATEVGVTGIMNYFGDLPQNHWLNIAGNLAQNGHSPLLITYMLTQVSGLGVDVMHLFSLSPEGAPHVYSGPVSGGELRGWQAYPLSHVWSISCELVFYLLAPALNGLRTRSLVFWIILATAANFMAPWLLGKPLANVATSFIAPFQMGFFALGMLSYRLYKHPLVSGRSVPVPLRLLIVAVLGAVLLFYQKLPQLSYTGSLACLYGSAALGVPFLFQWSKNLHWDRVLGELSYPVYLAHITVIRVLDSPALHSIFGRGFYGTLWHALTAMAGAVLVAWVLIQVFDRRIDEWRQRRANAAKMHPRSVTLAVES